MVRPTIKDVSKLAGVSIGTVSNVVNGHPNISPKTRKKVEDAIEKLGYEANRAAKSLPAGRTGLLGYRMPDATRLNSSMDMFLHQVVDSAGSLGLEVLLFTPGNGQDELSAYDRVLKRGGVDAFILSGIEYDDPRVTYLHERRVPFGAFGKIAHQSRSVWVDVDGAAGTRLAVAHLLEHGVRRIAFLGWPEGSQTGDRRLVGWREGLLKGGVTPEADWVFRREDGFIAGRELVPELMEMNFEAVVCASDNFALGLMSGLRLRGYLPGQDLRVIGFDDVAAAELAEPGLTTVRQPMAAIGRELISRLSRLLRREALTSPGTFLEPELIVRGSSGFDRDKDSR